MVECERAMSIWRKTPCNLEVTCGLMANMTCGQVERWHVSEPGWDTCSNMKVTRGQAGIRHVVEPGGSWISARGFSLAHHVSVYRRNMLLARCLTALKVCHVTCQRGRRHVDLDVWWCFYDALQKQKWFGDESCFVIGKISSVALSCNTSRHT